jgi:copper chaperone CopZ
MATAIIILIIIALICIAIRRIYRTIRFGGSCCSAGTDMDKKIKVKDKKKANYPFSYKLKVDGMVCSGCVRRVENAINKDGELWAKVDLEHKEVNVLAKKEMTREDFRNLLMETPYTILGME